jgi:hypothetical protein
MSTPTELPPPAPCTSYNDLQRVLYHVVAHYRAAVRGNGDDELLRSAIFEVAVPTLKETGWWPKDDCWSRADYDAARDAMGVAARRKATQ